MPSMPTLGKQEEKSMGTWRHGGRRPWKWDVAMAAGLLSGGDELQH